MKKLHRMLLCLLFLTATSFAESRIQTGSFYSPSVHDSMHVVILLPLHYDHSRRYPVLFLLHGYGGNQNDWTNLTHLEVYTERLALMVVMPEANNSWYINSQTDRNARYEDYIIHDLPKFVDSHFPIDTTREAIAGLSMGGYGALVLALRHPDKFLFAGDLSGAITIPAVIDSVLAHPHSPIPGDQGPIYPSIVKAFGDKNRKFRDDHNVFVLLQRERADSLPYIFCAVGIQDGYKDFLPAHRIFTNLLREFGKLYEYHEVPGVHNWKFWDEEIQPLLMRMKIVMKLDLSCDSWGCPTH
ncbi:MAG: esterase family protein [Bacteroidetes bacterium]|nr:esterase family protein [Bacteroidota bacterium]MCL5738527.1 esterase family protein [Bacteroidota bacterium]